MCVGYSVNGGNPGRSERDLPARLDPARAQLTVIDVQEAFRRKISAFDVISRRCAFLVRVCEALGLPVLACEQNPGRLGGSASELVSALGSLVPVPKMSFDACASIEFASRLAADRPQVVVAGIEAHVCVQQTVLGLLGWGREVFLVVDGTGSQRDRDAELATRRMVGAGAIPTSAEAVAFELLGTASNPAFRSVLELVMAELHIDRSN